MAQYCVGITMATDRGADDARGLDRRLVRRVLGYFIPYWRAALLALGCIAAGALLGLAPALVFRALIDELARAHPAFGTVLALVGAGIGAAIVGGLVGLAEDYLTERISQGIIFDLREELFDRLLHQSVAIVMPTQYCAIALPIYAGARSRHAAIAAPVAASGRSPRSGRDDT